MHSKRVLFIVKERNVYGTKTRCYGLFNSSNFIANKLNELLIPAKVVQVVDNNCIDRVVTEFKPTYCIIEALWVTPDKFRVLAKLHPKVNWNVRLHSASPFLAVEGISTQWLKEYLSLREEGIKISISVNHRNTVNDLYTFCNEVIYLPNIYYPKLDASVVELPVYEDHKNVVKVGCFGALRPLKNHFKQALLALRFANAHNKELHFFINKSEHESEVANPILKNLTELFKDNNYHKLISIPWYEHSDFIEIVKQMDFGMQLSFTESFNIVAADFVANGKPIVVSKSIEWMSDKYKVDIEDDCQILEKMELAYHKKSYHSDMCKLYEYNEKSTKYWVDYLNY